MYIQVHQRKCNRALWHNVHFARCEALYKALIQICYIIQSHDIELVNFNPTKVHSACSFPAVKWTFPIVHSCVQELSLHNSTLYGTRELRSSSTVSIPLEWTFLVVKPLVHSTENTVYQTTPDSDYNGAFQNKCDCKQNLWNVFCKAVWTRNHQNPFLQLKH